MWHISSRITRKTPRRRGGVATLEMILVLPVFLIALMAIAQFGLLLSNEQFVEMASRAGTQVASRLTNISETNGDPVPAAVLSAVGTELARIGITDYSVRLEHNIDFDVIPPITPPVIGPVIVLESFVGTGPTNCPAPSAVALAPNRMYVRVTVCVKSTELTPNMLNTYGIDFSIRVSDETTLRRYAL